MSTDVTPRSAVALIPIPTPVNAIEPPGFGVVAPVPPLDAGDPPVGAGVVPDEPVVTPTVRT